jgi:hypothetical protein
MSVNLLWIVDHAVYGTLKQKIDVLYYFNLLFLFPVHSLGKYF